MGDLYKARIKQYKIADLIEQLNSLKLNPRRARIIMLKKDSEGKWT